MKANWIIVENSEARQFYEKLEDIYNLTKKTVRYICGQLEIGEEGHLHFQGYIQLKRTQRLSWLKNHISKTAHFEPQFERSTNEQAREYAMKEETREDEPKELGTFSKGRGPQKRNDLEGFRDKILSGTTKRELLQTNINEIARYPKLYDTIAMLRKPVRVNNLEVILHYGEPGTGKSQAAREMYEDIYDLPDGDTLWFDGMDGERSVLWEDFSGKSSKLGLVRLLRYLDKYPMRVPYKGGHTWYMPDAVVITTNVHPRDWYEWIGREVHWRALKRRFTKVRIFEEDFSFTEVDVEEFMQDQDYWTYKSVYHHGRQPSSSESFPDDPSIS